MMTSTKHETLNPKQLLNSNDLNSKRFGLFGFRYLNLSALNYIERFSVSKLEFRICLPKGSISG